MKTCASSLLKYKERGQEYVKKWKQSEVIDEEVSEEHKTDTNIPS